MPTVFGLRKKSTPEIIEHFSKSQAKCAYRAGTSVRGITDAFLESRGIDLKVTPISILDQDFERQVGKRKRSKTKAAEAEHAIRHHLAWFSMISRKIRSPQEKKEIPI